MFFQVHYISLDDKGRLFMPATFRRDAPQSVLEGDFFITPEKDHCLVVRPRQEWDANIARIKRARVESHYKDELLRSLSALSQMTSLDRQHRLVVSPQMRRYLGVAPDEGRVELAVVGAGSYFEIWRADKFEGEEALLAKITDLRDRIGSVIDEDYD